MIIDNMTNGSDLCLVAIDAVNGMTYIGRFLREDDSSFNPNGVQEIKDYTKKETSVLSREGAYRGKAISSWTEGKVRETLCRESKSFSVETIVDAQLLIIPGGEEN